MSEDPPKLALAWLNKVLTHVAKIEAENLRMHEWINTRPTGTKIQREQQILKRMEAAEAECNQLREALNNAMTMLDGSHRTIEQLMKEARRCSNQ